MSLKFEKTMRTLRPIQNYLVLIKKIVSDKHAQTSNVIRLSTIWLLIFRLEVKISW